MKRWGGMLGAPAERFQVFPFLQFGHNYNAVSRRAMYGFVNRHFQLGHEEPIEERDFLPLTREEMSVWNEEHPAPRSRGAVHERALLDWWAKNSKLQMASMAARMADDDAVAEKFHQVVGGGWATIVGRTLDEAGPIEYTLSAKRFAERGIGMTGLLTASRHGEQVPALFLHPGESWNGEVLLWIHSEGKETVLDEGGQVRQELLALAARSQCGGATVIGATLVNLSGRRLGTVASMEDPWFVPGAVKYGDVPSLVALAAPAPVLMVGEEPVNLAPALAAYAAEGQPERLTVRGDEFDAPAVFEWLQAQ